MSLISRYNPPPDKPTSDLDVPYKDQPRNWLTEDLSLHPYQLEGISWARHSWNHGKNDEYLVVGYYFFSFNINYFRH